MELGSHFGSSSLPAVSVVRLKLWQRRYEPPEGRRGDRPSNGEPEFPGGCDAQR